MTVEFNLGGDWLAAAARLCELRSRAGEQGWALSLERILGCVDLVLDDDNITAHVPPDASAILLAELLDAARSLCDGAPKATIRFSETPWELILAARPPDAIALSLLGAGLDPTAIAHNRPVAVSVFLSALATAADGVRAALLAIDPGFAGNPLVARLDAARQRLPTDPRVPGDPAPPRGAPEPLSGTASAGGAALRFEFDAAHPDLRTFDPSEPFDLHALLAPGALALDVGGRSLSLSAGRPVLTAMRLLGEVERLARDLSAHRQPTPVRGWPLLTLLTAPAPGAPLWHTPLKIQWRPERPITTALSPRRGASEPVIEVSLTPLALVDLTAGLTEALCRGFVVANPALVGAARLVELRARSALLRSRVRAQLAGNLRLAAPERYLKTRSDVRLLNDPPSASPPGPFSLQTMRRISMRCRWSHTAQGIDWGAIWFDGDRVVVPSDEGIAGLSISTGQQLFEVPWEPGQRPSLVRDGRSAVTLGPGGVLRALDLREGRTLWSSAAPEGWGRLVGLRRFERGGARWWVLVADGGLMAVDPLSGEVKWRAPDLIGAVTDVRARAEALAVSTREGQLLGVDPVTGEFLWRTHVGAGRVRWLGDAGDPRWIWAVCEDPVAPSAVLWGIDRLDGLARWTCALPGRPVGALMSAGRRAVLSLVGASGAVAVAVDLVAGVVSWTQPLPGLQLAGPTAPLLLSDPGGARALIKTDDGALLALDVETGERVWQTRIGGEGEALFRNAALQSLDGVIVAAGGEVVLIDPRGGQITHRLGELDRRPAWLRALPGPNLLVGDDDLNDDPATLSCYGAAHFLALVTGSPRPA